MQKVIQANHRPTAMGDTDTATTGIGGTASGNVLRNDSDPDGDTLVVTGFVGGSHGGLVLNQTGSFIYTVANLTGPTGSHLHDLFTYGVSDGKGGVASATLDVTLNRAPVAVNDSAAATTGVGGTASGNVLDNDSDPDGDTLTVTGFIGGNHGDLVLSQTGSFTYTVTNLSGPTGSHLHDVFTYGVSDGNGGVASANLDVDITLNRGPTSVNDVGAVLTGLSGGGTLTVGAQFGALSNDMDPDGDQLTVTAVSGGSVGVPLFGAHGNLTMLADGSYSYVVTNLSGAVSYDGYLHDVFTYTASDGKGGTSNASVDLVLKVQGQTLMGGNKAQTLLGTLGDDVMSGGNAKDILYGNAGDDSISGNNGTDYLDGGLGNDVLSGGNGRDIFAFSAHSGRDRISDFSNDAIQVDRSVASGFAALQMTDDASGNAVIAFTGVDAVTVIGVHAAQLHASDFLFV